MFLTLFSPIDRRGSDAAPENDIVDFKTELNKSVYNSPDPGFVIGRSGIFIHCGTVSGKYPGPGGPLTKKIIVQQSFRNFD